MEDNKQAQPAGQGDAEAVMQQIQQAAQMIDQGLSVMSEGLKDLDPAMSEKMGMIQQQFHAALGLNKEADEMEEGIPGGKAPGTADAMGGPNGQPVSPAGK